MEQVIANPRILPTHLVTEGTRPEGWRVVPKVMQLQGGRAAVHTWTPGSRRMPFQLYPSLFLFPHSA